jgi:fluoroquinolone resistance protein
MATIEQLLTGESFDDQTWSSVDLTDADLGKKDFCNCTFTHVKLQQSRWKGARLEDCRFEACDLTRSAPAQLGLRGVEFKGCKMLGIDWTKVGTHPVMSFVDCNLSYSSFVAIAAQKIRFTRCVLVEANFIQVDLTRALFEDCQLAGARFDKCHLERASFAGSRDLRLDPAANRVRGASIPLEAAVSLASSFGLQVIGFSPDAPQPDPRPARRKTV